MLYLWWSRKPGKYKLIVNFVEGSLWGAQYDFKDMPLWHKHGLIRRDNKSYKTAPRTQGQNECLVVMLFRSEVQWDCARLVKQSLITIEAGAISLVFTSDPSWHLNTNRRIYWSPTTIAKRPVAERCVWGPWSVWELSHHKLKHLY